MFSKMAIAATALAAAAFTGGAEAQETLKIGFIGTLSTPAGYIGADQRDAFNLAIKEGDGKLGGVPVELVVEDDALKPANARQAADRMLQSGIRLFTGINFSNVLMAVAPSVLKADAFYISLNAGPSNFAGKDCNKNYFVVSFQNDAFHAAGGLAANELGYKKMVLLASNYQAGRDALAGFKETYKGTVESEIYAKLDQTDYSVEIARVRSMAPQGIYDFFPGGAGINFLKQYANSGLSQTVPMVLPMFSADLHVVEATGDAGKGVYLAGTWSPEMDNPQTRTFVANFKKAYGRLPTLYAMQSYDTANLIASALKASGPDIKAKADVFRSALKKADFTSLRGNFKFGNNQHPIQDYYLFQLQPSAGGHLAAKPIRVLAKNQGDVYAAQCKL